MRSLRPPLLPASSQAAGDVDAARLKAADSQPQNWFTLGRDGNQTYFSPLATIDASNVDRLGSTPAQLVQGEIKFVEQCSRCHAFGLSITPDLRKMPPEVHAQFKDIVLKGDFAPLGMERFDDVLTEADADAIHAYLIDQARQIYKQQ